MNSTILSQTSPLRSLPPSFDPYSYKTSGELLRGYLACMKGRNRYFSISQWAKRLQLPTSGVLVNFLKERRIVSEEMAMRIASDMRLNREQSHYFQSLADRDRGARAESSVLPFLERRVASLRMRARTTVLDESVYGPVSGLRSLLLKELVNLRGARVSEPEWVFRRSRLPIAPEETARTLEAWVARGILRREPDGSYRNAVENWESADGISSASLRKFHRESLENAVGSLETVPVGRRYFSSYVLPVSRRRIKEATARIDEFLLNFVAEFGEEAGVGDEVYQVNLNFVPLTNSEEGERE